MNLLSGPSLPGSKWLHIIGIDIDKNRQVITESTMVPVTPVRPEGTAPQPLWIIFQEEAW